MENIHVSKFMKLSCNFIQINSCLPVLLFQVVIDGNENYIPVERGVIKSLFFIIPQLSKHHLLFFMQ